MVNQVGLSRKHIFDAVEKSVERLGTYIDVLQIYRLDRDTPPEEMMKALNDVIENNRSSKRAEADKFHDVLVHQREDALDKKIVGRVEEVAKKHNVSMACIATAWTIKKGVCPIIGLSSKERIDETVKNIHFKLSGEDAKYLEEVYVPKFRQIFRRYHTGCVTLMQKYNPKDHKHK